MNQLQVKIKKLHPDAKIPFKPNVLNGAYDVSAIKIEQVSNDFVICHLGWALEFPHPYRLRLVPRSSFTKTHWILQNSPGLGESNYRDGYQLRFRALPIGISKHDATISVPYERYRLLYPEFPYKVGDRLGQVYFDKEINVRFNEVQPYYTDEEVIRALEETGYQQSELKDDWGAIALKEGFEFCMDSEYWRNYHDDDLDYSQDRMGGFGSSGK